LSLVDKLLLNDDDDDDEVRLMMIRIRSFIAGMVV